MKFKRLTSGQEIKSLIQWHNQNSKFVVLDFETTGFDEWTDKITDIVLTGKAEGEVVCFGVEFLNELLNIKCLTVWQNFKYDFKIAYRGHGIDLRRLPGGIRDTMLMDHLVDENNEHGLDAQVQRRYGDNYKEVFWSKYKEFSDAPESEQIQYMCKDGYYTNLRYYDLSVDLANDEIGDDFVQYVHDLALALYDSELTGVNVDLQYLGEQGKELKTNIETSLIKMRNLCDVECAVIEMRMWEKELEKRKTSRGKAGVKKPEFNFSSSKQVVSLLYDELELPVQFNYNKKTRTRSRSKDDAALEKLKGLHPIVDELQGLSTYEKMYGTFIEGVLERARDAIIYPTFNVNGTVTGRISASSPNLQQLPASNEWSKLRGIFVPSDGHRIITADYGQLEVCIAAHYSQDPLMLKMVRNGESMHDYTAKATGLTRDQAKKMNFTVLYGGTEYKIAQDLGCDVKEAKKYLELLLNTYRGLKRLMEDCHRVAERGGSIPTLFGRRRHFSGQYESFAMLQKAKRQAFNSLIQGTGADFTHKAFTEIAKEFKARKLGRALFPVHDENVTESLINTCTDAQNLISFIMTDMGVRYGLLVPLTVKVSEPMERWSK